MKDILNLRDLLIVEGRTLYDSNCQELKELNDFELLAFSPSLKQLIHKRIQQLENQQQLLKRVFYYFQEKPEGGKCEATKAILNRMHRLIDQSQAKEIRDVCIISFMQQLSHRKMATLGNGASHAREIGQEQASRDLHDALVEEKNMDRKLSCLAQLKINRRAIPA